MNGFFTDRNTIAGHRPFPILNISKIGKEKAIDGRKRKILYRTERTNL